MGATYYQNPTTPGTGRICPMPQQQRHYFHRHKERTTSQLPVIHLEPTLLRASLRMGDLVAMRIGHLLSSLLRVLQLYQ